MAGKKLSHYKIEAELGRGGMEIVYRAEDTKLDRTVAINTRMFCDCDLFYPTPCF